MRCRRSSKCAPSAVMRLRRCDVISSQCCGVLALLNIQFLPAWEKHKYDWDIRVFHQLLKESTCMSIPNKKLWWAYRDSVFCAGVYDWLQQVVKLCDVQLSFQQQFLGLLLHSQSYGCSHLLLYCERQSKISSENAVNHCCCSCFHDIPTKCGC